MHNWQCVCCAGLFSKPSWQSPFRHTYKSILRCISNTIFIGQFVLIHKCLPIWISFFVILRVRFRFFQFSSVWIAEKERIIYGKLVCFMSLFSFFFSPTCAMCLIYWITKSGAIENVWKKVTWCKIEQFNYAHVPHGASCLQQAFVQCSESMISKEWWRERPSQRPNLIQLLSHTPRITWNFLPMWTFLYTERQNDWAVSTFSRLGQFRKINYKGSC